MDVEQVQKINNLALQLMKQGLAPDRESAIAQAEQVFRHDKSTQQYHNMRETLQEVQADREPKRDNYSPDLSQNEIKQILEKNTQYIVGRLKEFNEKIASLERIIAELAKRTSRIQDMPTVNDLMAKGVEQADELEIKPKQAPPQPSPAKPVDPTRNHPRSGNYVENDVSIEKFFYMGNK